MNLEIAWMRIKKVESRENEKRTELDTKKMKLENIPSYLEIMLVE